MLATEAAVRRVDGRMEEAGLPVASPGRVYSNNAALDWAGAAAAALVIFVLALSEFGVPGLLRVHLFTILLRPRTSLSHE